MSAKSVINRLSRLVGGKEIFDPTPVAVPVNWKKPRSIQQMMAKYLADANEYAKREGLETFEEAEDFDVGDDEANFESPWELDFDPISGKEMYPAQKKALDAERERFDKIVKAKRKASKKKTESEPPAPKKESD